MTAGWFVGFVAFGAIEPVPCLDAHQGLGPATAHPRSAAMPLDLTLGSPKKNPCVGEMLC